MVARDHSGQRRISHAFGQRLGRRDRRGGRARHHPAFDGRRAGPGLPARNDTKDTDLLAVVNQPGTRIWIAAGTNGRILRSIDDGKNWSIVDSQLKIGFQTLFVDPISQAILIGGDEGLVGFSKDAGVSWQITAISMPEPATPSHRIPSLRQTTDRHQRARPVPHLGRRRPELGPHAGEHQGVLHRLRLRSATQGDRDDGPQRRRIALAGWRPEAGKAARFRSTARRTT